MCSVPVCRPPRSPGTRSPGIPFLYIVPLTLLTALTLHSAGQTSGILQAQYYWIGGNRPCSQTRRPVGWLQPGNIFFISRSSSVVWWSDTGITQVRVIEEQSCHQTAVLPPGGRTQFPLPPGLQFPTWRQPGVYRTLVHEKAPCTISMGHRDSA